MSNGEHEIRTPKGLRIGNRSVVDGKNMLQIKRGGCEDYISAESLVECMYLQFFAPNRSFCLVNVIRLVFVTAFLKNFLVFVTFVHLYKKAPCYLLISTNSMELHIKICFQRFSRSHLVRCFP